MVEAALPADHPRIVGIARTVYAELGDYGVIMPSWFAHPGVEAFVEKEGGDGIVAFSLLGSFEPLGGPRHLIVDMLALGVAPEHQRQGRGRRLLRHAIGQARRKACDFESAEIRLTVSESNTAACRLFSSEGFSVLDLHHGSYDRGQPAIRMQKTL